MRRILIALLSASFLTAIPPVPKVAEAKSLFEALFPRAAERRKQRIQRRRDRELRLFKFRQQQQRGIERRRKSREAVRRKLKQRRALSSGSGGVSSPKYYTYRARGLGYAPMAKVASAFIKQKAVVDENNAKNLQQEIDTHFNLKRMNLDSFAKRTATPEVASLSLVDFGNATRSLRVKARTGITKAITAHYRKSPAFLWLTSQGKPNERAIALMDTLSEASAFGLASEDYTLPDMPDGNDPKASAEFEFALTARALRYLSDARHGLVDPNRISGYHDFSKNYANYGKFMVALAAADEPRKLLEDAHPRDPAFEALKSELAALSKSQVDALPPLEIAPGTFIRPDDYNPELENVVEAIRRRAKETIKNKHAEVLAADHSVGNYSPEVVALVKDMQKGLGLRPDGIIGKNTIRRLLAGRKETPDARRQKVLLAMERLRWHPDRLGNTHVMINQPAYRVALKRGGRTELSMRAVVGKRSNQTNFFHDKISYVEFNPYWGIPRSILVNEYLPKLRRNAGYLDNRGYEITNVRGRQISSWDVDWWGVDNTFPYNVRQPPGPKNALGRLKIMFPNKHSIYMHDTPAKSLFKRDQRAFSHGCVRLAEPQKMAAAVLGTSISDIQNNIDQGQNRTRKLKRKMPVYVAYFTAWPNDDGKVQFYSDIYGRDAALRKAMKEERRVRGTGQRA